MSVSGVKVKGKERIMGLTNTRLTYKPFKYPWAYEYYKKSEQMHWLPEEVPMHQDVSDWENKLTPGEKNLLTQLFRFFTQADVVVSNNYGINLVPYFSGNPEIAMMLSSFGNREAIHIDSYSKLIETVGMPDSEYSAFLKYKEMSDKHEYLMDFGMDTPYNTAKTLATFAAFVEGVQVFSSFAIMMNFPRFGKMNGMGQIVTWSSKDEDCHCEGTIRLYHEWLKEHPEIDKLKLNLELGDICDKMIELEDRFIDLAFGVDEIQGLSKEEVKQYIRKMANYRLGQLNIPPRYNIVGEPLPWLDEMLYGVEHQNFFEGRGTEYALGTVEDDLV